MNTRKRDNDIDIFIEKPKRKKRGKDFWMLEFNVLTIITLMLLISCFLILGKRPTVSNEEQRELAKCPKFSISSYLDGTFTSEFAAFFNDSVPLRSTFKEFIAGFRGHLGIPYEGVELFGNVPTLENAPPPATEPPTETPTETAPPVPVIDSSEPSAPVVSETVPATEPVTEAPTEPPEEDVEGELTNNILIVKDRAIMLYGGGFSNGQAYAETLNQFKEKLGDVNVYSMVAPTSVSYYLPKKYQQYSASETENIDHINSFLNGVTPVDVYSALLPHKDEHTYSRTDHHWQPLGAFYAAEEFAKVAGVPFAPLTDYETVVKEGYVGTLYGQTNSKTLLDNPEDFTYYVPQNEYTTTYYDTDMTREREAPLLLNLDTVDRVSWYLVFMGGDERITHVTTDCHNGRVLCIIKDSYGNALVPCLTNSFEEIWVIDMRYFKPSTIPFIQEHGVTDLLFAMNTYSATGGNSKKLQTLLNQ